MKAPSNTRMDADYLLVGGGLQNALILLALAERQPEASILLLEREDALGGNHIWSFQTLDLPASAMGWAAPLIEYRWPGYQLHFRESSRWVEGTYSSMSSEQLDRVVRQVAATRANIRIETGAAVTSCDARGVTLSDGRVLHGRLVVDARGPDNGARRGGGGYQKFVGLECRLRQPVSMSAPILMDTRCDQRDGFRFHYVLPFAEDRVLIEDTYFSNDPALDVATLRDGIVAEAAGLGFEIESVLRTEVGVLPMPSFSTFSPRHREPLQGGYAGGWFNPGTGYSLAAAARLAEHLSSVPIDAVYGPAWRRLVRHIRVQSHFLAFLNLLMFGFFHDAQRAKLMERFYLLPDDVVHRFFAMETTLVDMWRIMWVGAPWTPKGWGKRAACPPD
ncbi:lycopene beta-cyclase CrtY [uncultured Thiocystis sp.]|uniref:lycopene beta-cyclase CrtY n=1 Tax=uncultured Thiocystis sp. TaxID=1202134 RepID=UPI0025D43F6A|nr:lycopene beta-cyclase CrtY [uncultured Thiocystis sp.]